MVTYPQSIHILDPCPEESPEVRGTSAALVGIAGLLSVDEHRLRPDVRRPSSGTDYGGSLGPARAGTARRDRRHRGHSLVNG